MTQVHASMPSALVDDVPVLLGLLALLILMSLLLEGTRIALRALDVRLKRCRVPAKQTGGTGLGTRQEMDADFEAIRTGLQDIRSQQETGR